MSDIRLSTTTGDIDLEGDSVVLTEGKEAIEQNIRQRLKLFYGEWFLERRRGIPYFEHIFVKRPNATVIDAIFKAELLDVPGVTELQAFDILVDTATREMQLTARVDTTDGVIDFTQELVA